MSRSGYSEECDGWALICWRGAVKKAIEGKRGQAFLLEMKAALEAMPKKELIDDELVTPQGDVCALGSVGLARGIDMSDHTIIDDRERVAHLFGIAPALAAEIMFLNDDYDNWSCINDPLRPQKRYDRVLRWVNEHIKEVA